MGMTGTFRRSVGIGAIGPVAIFVVLLFGLFLAGRLGGEAGAVIGGIGFLPSLVALVVLYLLVLVVVASVPRWRDRAGSGGGLFLGWLLGGAVVAGVIALVLAFV